jgi:hypothetical protein
MDFEKLLKNKYFQYFLYALFFALLYFGIIRKKVFENFDSNDSGSGDETLVAIQDADGISDDLKNNTEKMKDAINLSKYRSNLEDLIINLEDWTNAKAASYLPTLAKKLNETTNEAQAIKIMQNFNAFYTFPKVLNDMMTYVDKQ